MEAQSLSIQGATSFCDTQLQSLALELLEELIRRGRLHLLMEHSGETSRWCAVVAAEPNGGEFIDLHINETLQSLNAGTCGEDAPVESD